MASLNKVMLIGNLGKDPEVRFTAAGQAVTSFSLATSEKFKNKSGEMEERTEWHNITLWGKLAKIAGEYLSKGKTVYIEGRLQTRKWQDKEGVERYTTEIIAEQMQLLGSRGGAASGDDGGYSREREPAAADGGRGAASISATAAGPRGDCQREFPGYPCRS